LVEFRGFLRELFGEVGLAFEDGFEVAPLRLYLYEHFDCFGDLGDIVVPKIDLLLKLFVER